MSRDEIMLQLRERLKAYAATQVGRDTAEDVAQEVLLVLHEKYHHVEEAVELVPLSFQILRFKLQSLQRKVRRRGEAGHLAVADLPLPDSQPDPEQQVEQRERQERLMRAVQRLSAREQELLRHKLAGLTYLEIQRRMGARSLNTVYTWDARCRRHLQELLAEEERRG